MIITKLLNCTLIARELGIEKHRVLMFRNGVDSALTHTEKEAVLNHIKEECSKTCQSIERSLSLHHVR